MRVQIPAYCDMWMRGARFGMVVKIIKSRKLGARDALLTGARKWRPIEIAYVRLDLTGKIVRVILADCEVI